MNETSTNIVATPHPNIVATIEGKERKEKSLDQFANLEIHSKKIEGLEVKKIINIVQIMIIKE